MVGELYSRDVSERAHSLSSQQRPYLRSLWSNIGIDISNHCRKKYVIILKSEYFNPRRGSPVSWLHGLDLSICCGPRTILITFRSKRSAKVVRQNNNLQKCRWDNEGNWKGVELASFRPLFPKENKLVWILKCFYSRPEERRMDVGAEDKPF